MKLAGKTVLVTGGGRRVGAALVRAFSAAGARVLIHCNQGAAEAHELAGELTNARVIECDFLVGVPEFGEKVDVLVNNASTYRRDDSDEARRINRRINCEVPLLLMERFFTQASSGGVILNLLDQAVLRPGGEDAGGYLDSKRSLYHATRSLACRFAPHVRVCAIAPGPVLPPVGMESSRMEKTLKQVPLGRPVAMTDLTDAALFLVTNESITGAVLPVDGGQHLFDCR